jgi:asparagine synthase (glutamine-hydrolysing)
MCGISGIYNFNGQAVGIETLKRFTDSMFHRGPDGSGYELLNDNTLGLGQRRLSILDLSILGKQPMSYADGRYWITYNGEVFNFESIKSELMHKGYVFISNTDTEVILASYIEWGKDCLSKFNGMWAFAIWDDSEQELFLARDRFGIKPLYYSYIPGESFSFASETRAFKYLNGFNRSINNDYLNITLEDPYALEGLGYTIFENIFQILPGHFLTIRNNEAIVQKRWWHINDHLIEVPNKFEEQAEKFYELFRDACRLRLISDVPIGTALSGGLDSTAVYSTVFDILKSENLGRVDKDSQRAFTAIFPGLAQDEQKYAEKAAAYTGGPITYIESDVNNLIQQIEYETELSDFVNVFPISSISNVYKGMRNNGIVVSMDGHGVDEMLYGYRDMVYSLYNEALWHKWASETKSFQYVLENLYHPNQWSNEQAKFDRKFDEKIQRESSVFYKLKRSLKGKSANKEFLPVSLPNLSDKPYQFDDLSMGERMLRYETFQHTLPTLLRNFDRAGMMNSVEIRMPFMDWRLVSYIFSLPQASKIGHGFTKRIVRESMKGKMDESLRTRTYKVGIKSPIEHWINGELKGWALDTLKDNSLKQELSTSIKSSKELSAQTVKEIWQNINTEIINKK